MHCKVQKWGNSLAIRIPQQQAKALNLSQGSQIDINLQNHNLIISPSKSRLDELLEAINEQNRHNEIMLEDNSVGIEEW